MKSYPRISITGRAISQGNTFPRPSRSIICETKPVRSLPISTVIEEAITFFSFFFFLSQHRRRMYTCWTREIGRRSRGPIIIFIVTVAAKFVCSAGVDDDRWQCDHRGNRTPRVESLMAAPGRDVCITWACMSRPVTTADTASSFSPCISFLLWFTNVRMYPRDGSPSSPYPLPLLLPWSVSVSILHTANPLYAHIRTV